MDKYLDGDASYREFGRWERCMILSHDAERGVYMVQPMSVMGPCAMPDEFVRPDAAS